MTLYTACVLDNLRTLCVLIVIISTLGLFLLNIWSTVENDEFFKYTPYILIVLVLSALGVILIPPFNILVKFI
jgi:hypothetical protein